ncbi:hypothetical protein T12_9228 [Trichinella patagoniensis]|uniref:Uncharacterized protein n=1 Tax=Trichinella patagoniensis TaxID=990121 RepID=A0A0V0YRW3_9BILA|nr:hypothetical protein T12_9228 [Trichinella patagoniensis]
MVLRLGNDYWNLILAHLNHIQCCAPTSSLTEISIVDIINIVIRFFQTCGGVF